MCAYLERRIATARTSIEAAMADVPPDERALRVFDWVIAWTEAPGFRGCPLQHVTGELSDPAHPARAAVASQREWLGKRFLEWARDAGAVDAKRLGGALLVLFDGAVAASELDGPERPTRPAGSPNGCSRARPGPVVTPPRRDRGGPPRTTSSATHRLPPDPEIADAAHLISGARLAAF